MVLEGGTDSGRPLMTRNLLNLIGSETKRVAVSSEFRAREEEIVLIIY